MSLQSLKHIFIQTTICSHLAYSSVRLYGRWMHRNPAKVLMSFESSTKTSLKKENVIELEGDKLNKSKEQHKIEATEKDNGKKFPADKAQDIKKKREEALKKKKLYVSQTKVFDDNHDFIYKKLKENDSRISSLLVNLKNKKERARTQQVLVEGWRMIVDGLEAKCSLRYIIFSSTEDLNNLRPFMPKTGVQIYKMPYKEIELWSDVETSPGIIGVFETPKPENFKSMSKPLPLQLICDNIRVPGNLGAILRAASGVGCEKVLLTKGCVDPWDPKVIRSAAGAHFRLPIYPSIYWDEMPRHLEEDTSIFIADSNAKLSEDLDDSFEDKLSTMQIPVLPYYSVEFASLNHITLIIGGETEGISIDSYNLAARNNGLRLHIPLQKGVDSLNTGMATAVIAFEIRKQVIQAKMKEKMDRQMGHIA